MNKLSFTLLPLVFWTSCVSSKQQDLWQGRPPPGEIPVVQAGGDPRGRALDPLRITDVACPTLTVYKPAHLQEFKVPAELHIFRSGGHGISDESLGHSAHNWIAIDWMHFEPAAGGVQTTPAKP